MSQNRWDDYENEDYDLAGFNPIDLNEFTPLKESLSAIKGLTAGQFQTAMNLEFENSNLAIPPITSEQDFRIVVEAFLNIQNEPDYYLDSSLRMN